MVKGAVPRERDMLQEAVAEGAHGAAMFAPAKEGAKANG